jgi:hypothetical protein
VYYKVTWLQQDATTERYYKKDQIFTWESEGLPGHKRQENQDSALELARELVRELSLRKLAHVNITLEYCYIVDTVKTDSTYVSFGEKVENDRYTRDLIEGWEKMLPWWDVKDFEYAGGDKCVVVKHRCYQELVRRGKEDWQHVAFILVNRLLQHPTFLVTILPQIVPKKEHPIEYCECLECSKPSIWHAVDEMINDWTQWAKKKKWIMDPREKACVLNQGETMKIGVNEFVKRQTPESQFTHFKGTWEKLVEITTAAFDKGCYTEGYRDGVVLVQVPTWLTECFFTYTDFPVFEGMEISAECKKTPSRMHEPATVQIEILEPKKKCNFVDVILYRKDVLAEDADNSTDADWEIISINGRLNFVPPPMKALTIVRNWMHLPGGTEMKDKTPEEALEMLCHAVLYENNMGSYMGQLE